MPGPSVHVPVGAPNGMHDANVSHVVELSDSLHGWPSAITVGHCPFGGPEQEPTTQRVRFPHGWPAEPQTRAPHWCVEVSHPSPEAHSPSEVHGAPEGWVFWQVRGPFALPVHTRGAAQPSVSVHAAPLPAGTAHWFEVASQNRPLLHVASGVPQVAPTSPATRARHVPVVPVKLHVAPDTQFPKVEPQVWPIGISGWHVPQAGATVPPSALVPPLNSQSPLWHWRAELHFEPFASDPGTEHSGGVPFTTQPAASNALMHASSCLPTTLLPGSPRLDTQSCSKRILARDISDGAMAVCPHEAKATANKRSHAAVSEVLPLSVLPPQARAVPITRDPTTNVAAFDFDIFASP